jgi:hypothetical protein
MVAFLAFVIVAAFFLCLLIHGERSRPCTCPVCRFWRWLI